MSEMAIGAAVSTAEQADRGRIVRRIFRAVVAIEGLLIFGQAALAGQFLGGSPDALNWHQLNAFLIFFGAIALIVLAAILWRRDGPAWPTVASTLLLVAVVLQAAFGYARQLAFHVPLGVALFGLVLALLFGVRGGATRR